MRTEWHWLCELSHSGGPSPSRRTYAALLRLESLTVLAEAYYRQGKVEVVYGRLISPCCGLEIWSVTPSPDSASCPCGAAYATPEGWRAVELFPSLTPPEISFLELWSEQWGSGPLEAALLGGDLRRMGMVVPPPLPMDGPMLGPFTRRQLHDQMSDLWDWWRGEFDREPSSV